MDNLFKSFLAMVAFFFIQLGIVPASRAQSSDYCQLRGSVYIEEKYPRSADFIVYVEESEAFADLLVYKEVNSLFADRKGIWFFTENRDFADFWIYITKEKEKADFSIYYTDVPSFAGCN